MPNLFAQIALCAWVPIALLLFRLLGPVTGAATTLLGAVALLPANFALDLPGIPPIDRHAVGGIAVLAGYVLAVPRRGRRLQDAKWPAVLIATLAACTFVSTVMNPDALSFGNLRLPALTWYDALGRIFERCLTIGVPFYVGSRLVRSHEDLLAVLRVIVLFGLAYVPLILWEARMSPQLHTTLYGYFPHIFRDHLRAGGYRPVVFTSTGLECALFMATAVIASVGLMQARVRVLGMPTVLPVLLLMLGLVICKGLGSMIYGICIPALMLTTRATTQAKVGLFLSGVILFYPLLRSQDLFPTSHFVSAAETLSEDRAHSLDFRFQNEDLLLGKARERYWFGWGSWGRNHVYDETTGSDVSVTDGYWIIEIGTFGLAGFLCFFGLLLAPLVLTARRLRFVPRGRPRQVVAAVVLLVLVRAVDLIPNGFLAPITLFLSGSLMQFTYLRSPSTRKAAGPAPIEGRARPRPSGLPA